MRLLFIGGTRFIGRQAVELAHRRGHEIIVLHRGQHNFDLPKDVSEIHADRMDLTSLANAVKQVSPECVVDTCAMTAAAAKTATSAMRGLVANVVVVSSQDVYAQFGRLNGHPAPLGSELVDELAPLTVPYPFRGIADHDGGDDYDKKLVESEYRSACESGIGGATILRLPAVYGAGDYQGRFRAIIETLDEDPGTMLCQGRAAWRWTQGHVKNMAHAIVLAAESRVPGFEIFNVAEEYVPTMRERVESFAKLIGVSFEWREVNEMPEDLSILGHMPNDFVVSSSKIRARLGYSEIFDTEQAYSDLIQWIRSTRRLRGLRKKKS